MNKFNLRQSLVLQEYSLDNGLKIILVPKPQVPLVCIHLAYKVGSKNDKRGKTGFAHLFEHLMFEGSKNLPKGKFDKLCSVAGGVNNAFTSYDQTSYYMTLPSNQLELGLWLESDRLENLLIDQTSLDTQKGVVVEEIKQTVDEQPYGMWTGELEHSAYTADSPYFWEIHGSIKDIENAKLTDVQKYHDNFYRPESAALVIAGDIKPDKVIKQIEAYFNPIKNQTLNRKSKSEMQVYPQSGTYSQFSENVPMPAVFLAFHCPGFMEDSINTGEVLSYIAGSGRSSRLYGSLVYNKQIASYATSFLDKRELDSLLVFYAIANSPATSCEELYKSLITEIKKITEKSVSNEELLKAKNQLTTQLAYEMQYTSGIAENLANIVLFWNEPERIYTLLEKYNRINQRELKSFAGKYLNPSLAIRVDAVCNTSAD